MRRRQKIEFYNRKNISFRYSRGFTLIELLVVIAIIGILSSVVLASITVARSKARDSERKTTLRQLETALQMYFDDHKSYPLSSGGYYSSEPGDNASNNGGNWIPGLAPTYIPVLPRDPTGGPGVPDSCIASPWNAAYLYRSDGQHFTLLAHCSVENPWSSRSGLYDPIRPTWALKVCSDVVVGCNL